MWDGYWMLANSKAWQALPDDLRALATKHLNASALDQRADLEKLNTSLRQDLETKGIEFKTVDKEPFRQKLRQAGFFNGVEGQIRRGGLVGLGEIHRQDRLIHGRPLERRVDSRLRRGLVGPGWGNGKAAAALYAREGARVIAVDRDLAAAEETAAIIAFGGP